MGPLGLAAAAALLAFACAAGLRADPAAYTQTAAPAPPNSQQMGQLKAYGERVGETWLQDNFGIDLPAMAGDLGQGVQDSLEDAWRRDGWADVAGSGPGEAEGAAGGSGAKSGPKGVSVRIVGSGGPLRLGSGIQGGVPLGVDVRDNIAVAGAALKTRLHIPLSPDDAWTAEARLPLTLSRTAESWWWRGLGLGRAVSLRSDMSSRLGINQVEAGMGTAWRPGFWGTWSLDYDWQVTYGEGPTDATNWLRVSKRF